MNQTMPCPREATCPRCRDLERRDVQPVLRYALEALCPLCGQFAREARRLAR